MNDLPRRVAYGTPRSTGGTQSYIDLPHPLASRGTEYYHCDMPSGDEFFTLISTRTFDATAEHLLDGARRAEIERLLANAPHAGDAMPRTGGFRSVSFPHTDPGASEGLITVIYFVEECERRVYLLLVFRADEKDALTRSEEKELRRVARQLAWEA